MGSYKRNRFIDVKEGDIVNLRSYAMGKTTMSQVTVTFVGTSFFSVNNGVRIYSKDSGRSNPWNNTIVTHYVKRVWQKI